MAVVHRSRSYAMLQVLRALLILGGAFCILVGVVMLLSLSGRRESEFGIQFLSACSAFGASVWMFVISELIQLAIHVADDIYRLRMIGEKHD